jgi:RND superfamily putative drug exporter
MASYDVFLISRVVELRRMGYENRDSIVLGVAHTGAIITAAGAIMAIAFMACS